MSASGLALYTHVLGAVEGGGFLYLLYRRHRSFERNPALALPVGGLLLFVVTEAALDVLPPAFVHLCHTVAAAAVAIGLAYIAVAWRTTDPATSPLYRDGERPAETTEMDDEILALLDASGTVLTPALISYDLGYSRESVNRHLRDLEERDLVERVDRGKYRLSEDGQAHPYWGVPVEMPTMAHVRRTVGHVRRSVAARLRALLDATQNSGR